MDKKVKLSVTLRHTEVVRNFSGRIDEQTSLAQFVSVGH